VADLGVRYVVEVPCDLTGWTATRLPEACPSRLDRLWKRGGPPWEKWRIKHA